MGGDITKEEKGNGYNPIDFTAELRLSCGCTQRGSFSDPSFQCGSKKRRRLLLHCHESLKKMRIHVEPSSQQKPTLSSVADSFRPSLSPHPPPTRPSLTPIPPDKTSLPSDPALPSFQHSKSALLFPPNILSRSKSAPAPSSFAKTPEKMNEWPVPLSGSGSLGGSVQPSLQQQPTSSSVPDSFRPSPSPHPPTTRPSNKTGLPSDQPLPSFQHSKSTLLFPPNLLSRSNSAPAPSSFPKTPEKMNEWPVPSSGSGSLEGSVQPSSQQQPTSSSVPDSFRPSPSPRPPTPRPPITPDKTGLPKDPALPSFQHSKSTLLFPPNLLSRSNSAPAPSSFPKTPEKMNEWPVPSSGSGSLGGSVSGVGPGRICEKGTDVSLAAVASTFRRLNLEQMMMAPGKNDSGTAVGRFILGDPSKEQGVTIAVKGERALVEREGNILRLRCQCGLVCEISCP